jgi:hypothetical protein
MNLDYCSRYGTFPTSVCVDDFVKLESDRGGDILNPPPIEILRRRPRKNPKNVFSPAPLELNAKWCTSHFKP